MNAPRAFAAELTRALGRLLEDGEITEPAMLPTSPVGCTPTTLHTVTRCATG
jgi:hypothetical protein